jgi:hypothetical protein
VSTFEIPQEELKTIYRALMAYSHKMSSSMQSGNLEPAQVAQCRKEIAKTKQMLALFNQYI